MNTVPTTVAFVGLGAMGFPMAGHLSQQYATRVYNRNKDRARAWLQQFTGVACQTPAEAAENCDTVFLCVGNDDDVRAVVYGDDGVLAGMRAGAVLVDHTTVSAELARELNVACQNQGVGFLDAPVSGGQAGAENGQLTIMVGGDVANYAQAEPIMEVYAKRIKHMGPCGTGQLTKMANQICIAGVVQGLSEALHFSHKAGLDGRAVVEAISQGAAQSWQMENRHNTMIDGEFDFGFAVDWMRKDLDIALRTASASGASLPLTALVDQFYADVQNMGGGRWDTSSLIQRLRRLDG